MRRRPIMGKSVLSLMTMAATKSGNLLTGTVDFTSAPGSSSSIRPLQLATVSSVTRKRRPASAFDQPRAWTRARRSSFASESSNCCRSCSIGSMLTTGRGPRRVQVETVDRGNGDVLGQASGAAADHLLPEAMVVRAARPRRGCEGVHHHEDSTAGTQPPSKTRTILGVPMLRTRKRGMSAHAAGKFAHVASA